MINIDIKNQIYKINPQFVENKKSKDLFINSLKNTIYNNKIYFKFLQYILFLFL